MSDILEKIISLTEPLLEGTDIFIVHVKIKPTNNIKLFLDADEGLNVSKSASINRKLYALLEEAQLFPDGDFSLEVSSPGIDEPLASFRQYKKNIGRTVLVTHNSEESPETLGIMKEATEEKLVLEIKLPKNKGTETVEIPFTDIKKTVVQVTF